MPLITRVTNELHALGVSSLRYASHAYELCIEEKIGHHVLKVHRDGIEVGYMGFQPYVTIDSPLCSTLEPGGRAINTNRQKGHVQLGPIWARTENLDYNLFWMLSTFAVSFSRKAIGMPGMKHSVFEFPSLSKEDMFLEKYSTMGFSLYQEKDSVRVFWEREYLPFSAKYLHSDNAFALMMSKKQLPK